MKERTSIQIERKTLKNLQKFRITKRDTYDEIITRFMEDKKNVPI